MPVIASVTEGIVRSISTRSGRMVRLLAAMPLVILQHFCKLGFKRSGASTRCGPRNIGFTRTFRKAERNNFLDYFSKGSPLNFIIAESIKRV